MTTPHWRSVPSWVPRWLRIQSKQPATKGGGPASLFDGGAEVNKLHRRK
jgi:hypothetical protein